VVLALLICGVIAIASALPRLVLAIQIVDQLRRPGAESWLSRATPAPRRAPLRLSSDGRSFAADLYVPAGRPSAVPLILVPGLVETGKDDERVPPFANLLARAGFPVVVPDLPSFLALRVHPDNLAELEATIVAV